MPYPILFLEPQIPPCILCFAAGGAIAFVRYIIVLPYTTSRIDTKLEGCGSHKAATTNSELRAGLLTDV